MDQLELNWAKTLSIFREQMLNSQMLDSITIDSFFAPLKIREVIDSDIIITIEFKYNYEIIVSERNIRRDIQYCF